MKWIQTFLFITFLLIGLLICCKLLVYIVQIVSDEIVPYLRAVVLALGITIAAKVKGLPPIVVIGSKEKKE